MSAEREATSATGPGNPYWKRPAGSTGAMGSGTPEGVWMCGCGRFDGIGSAGGAPVVVTVVVVVAACWLGLESARREYIAAVNAAPPPALRQAIMATDFDMVVVGI